ncbi:RNI-like protein [Dentipellis sp. KUC8613]|nr:RNI-like protein [Dentipellis sp. KUC8613]
MWTNASAKPPVGSFEKCARCEQQFTVTKYTMPADPPPGFLCHKCAKAGGNDPFKKPAVPRKRKSAAEKRTVTHYEERKLPSLVSLCVQLLSKHINDVEAFGDIGVVNLDRIIRALCRNRSLTAENVNLFYNVENSDLILYDATNLTPDSLISLAYLNPNLTSLRIDFCGRINDEVIQSWSKALPNLRRLELLGPYLVRPAAWVGFFEAHPDLEGFLIHQSPRFDLECMQALVKSCAGLTELRLKEIGNMKDSFLEHIGKLTSLTHLDLSDPSHSLSEEGLIALMSAVGPGLKSLNLSGNILLSDDFLKEGLQPHAQGLTSLTLDGLVLLTDAGGAALFGSWDAADAHLDSLSLARCRELGDVTLEAILAFAGHRLLSLNINGWRNTTEASLNMIGEKAKLLRKLDIGWHRAANDFVMKGILDGCEKIEEIKCWGCNHVTENCPRKVSLLN